MRVLWPASGEKGEVKESFLSLLFPNSFIFNYSIYQDAIYQGSMFLTPSHDSSRKTVTLLSVSDHQYSPLHGKTAVQIVSGILGYSYFRKWLTLLPVTLKHQHVIDHTHKNLNVLIRHPLLENSCSCHCSCVSSLCFFPCDLIRQAHNLTGTLRFIEPPDGLKQMSPVVLLCV